MTESPSERHAAALERLAQQTGDLSGVTAELLNEIRHQAVAEATEVATTMTAESKIQQHETGRKLALRLAAATIGWVWLAVGIIDWHLHRHLSIAQVPLAPAGRVGAPIGLLFSGLSLLFVVLLLVAARRNGRH